MLSVMRFFGVAYIHAVPYGFRSRYVLFKLVAIFPKYLQNFSKQSHEISSFHWLTGDLNQDPKSECYCTLQYSESGKQRSYHEHAPHKYGCNFLGGGGLLAIHTPF